MARSPIADCFERWRFIAALIGRADVARFQIHLTEEQSQKLKTLAARRGLSVSEVVRRCVDIALGSEYLPDHDEIKSKARAVVGACDGPEYATPDPSFLGMLPPTGHGDCNT